MIKSILMWALLCLTATFVCFSQNNEYSDTTHILNEITIKHNSVISRPDRKVILPDKETVRTSTDGLDLLRKLQLPHISINRLTNGITLSTGGTLKVYLNGVETTTSELASISPNDIIRIEYHDNPGARYSDADAVINYITKRHKTGGYVFIDSFDALGNGKSAAINNLSIQHASSKSIWSINADYFYLSRDNWIRDYTETWHFPDKDIERIETGSPVKIGNSGLQGYINYSFAPDENQLFNLRLTLDYTSVPNKEEGDRQTILQTTGSDAVTSIIEHTEERSLSPALGLYYTLKFRDSHSITFDATGSYMKSESSHSYSERCSDELISDINSNVEGYKYSIFANGVYEGRFDFGKLTAGIRHNYSSTANTYRNPLFDRIEIIKDESVIFGEYALNINKWDFVASISGSRLHYNQDNISTTKYSLRPTATISFTPINSLSLRYWIDSRDVMPSLSEMSDIEQIIQPGMVRRGNPILKPFRDIEQTFTVSLNKPFINIDICGAYKYQHHPVMESIIFENGIFVRTYENQHAFHRLMTESTISVRPWRDHLSISVSPMFCRYISYGNRYTHTYHIFRLRFGADITFGNWMLSFNTMSGPANYMYGEEAITEKDMNMLMLGYKRTIWSIQAGLFNAFMKEYSMKTVNMSSLTPYVSRAHCDKNTYATIKFTLSINYGRKVFANPNNVINHTDSDNGIMNSIK